MHEEITRVLIAKDNALQEPHKGVILQSAGGAPKGCDKRLCPFHEAGRTLTLSTGIVNRMASMPDKALNERVEN